MTLTRAASATCLLAFTLAGSSPCAAQDARADTPPPGPNGTAAGDTTGLLPPDHWTRHALTRLAAASSIGTDLAALAWPARRSTVRRILLDAAARPAASNQAAESHTAMARAWLDRFDAEFAERRIGPIAFTPPAVAARAGEGALLAGRAVPSPIGYDYTGPTPDNSETDVFVEIGATASIGRRFDLAADARQYTDGANELVRATAGARFGAAELWGGRREASYGPSPDGLTLSGRVPFDGGGLDTPAGFVLPGFLRVLGTVRVNQVVARFDRTGDVAEPWFVATRLSFAPSSRVAVGVNRAALFGGEGNEPVTLGRLLLVLFGITDSRGKDSDFENQVASLDVAWNPGGSVLLWAEYGFDDAGTAFVLVPGLSLGALWAGPSWAEALSIGGSVTGIASSCCGHPRWYFHGALADGWTDRGVLLGHPLGGNGLEAAFEWALDPATSRVLARGRFFVRDRGRENLYSPDRHGRTGGIEAWLQVMPGGFRLEAGLESEVGAGPDRWSALLRAAIAL
jgi:hypothetical protein